MRFPFFDIQCDTTLMSLSNVASVDEPADKFAQMVSLIACETISEQRILKELFYHIGRFVYIIDALDDIYQQYGYYLAKVQSISLTGADAMEKAANMMASLRENAPCTIGGATVTQVRDYQSGIARDLQTGESSEIPLPKSNVLEFILGQQGSVIARPSGTEPKVKFYYTAVGKTKTEAQNLLDACVAQMSK